MSMTLGERDDPESMDGSRRRRDAQDQGRRRRMCRG